ncbi:MAG: flavin reductase family protein [archaeon]|jgi:flavin reductase (DIM6/NTAB) family NADH-FMN oxidoreductase RutF
MDIKEALKLFPPRIVVLISTVDKDGNQNIAPHSEFINLYEEDRFLVVIDKTHDTYKNILETGEFVVALPTIDIAKSISICGKSFEKGVSEFNHASLTPLKANKVCAPLVKECVANFECELYKEYETLDNGAIIIGKVIDTTYDTTKVSDEISTRMSGSVALHVSKGRIYTTIKGKTIDTEIDFKEI